MPPIDMGKVIGFFGNGRLGSLTMKEFLSRGYKVSLVVRDPSKPRTRELEKLGASIVHMPELDFEELKSVLTEPSLIYVGGPFGAFQELIHFLKENESLVIRSVFVSSANAKAGDYCSYRKFEEYEDLILAKLENALIIRPTLIFGLKDDGNFGYIAEWTRKYPFFPIIGSGRTPYQPVHYEDLKDAIVGAFLASDPKSRVFFIGGKDEILYLEIVQYIKKRIHSHCLLLRLPKWLLLLIATTVGRIVKLPLTKEQISRVDVDLRVDIQPAVEELGYSPEPFFDRMSQAIQEYQEK